MDAAKPSCPEMTYLWVHKNMAVEDFALGLYQTPSILGGEATLRQLHGSSPPHHVTQTEHCARLLSVFKTL